MIITKFGGSSIQTAELIRHSLSIASNHLPDPVVMVFSAIGKTTDILEDLIYEAQQGNKKVDNLLETVQQQHLSLCEDLGIANHSIEVLLSQLSSFAQGLRLLKECTPRSRDALLSFGELLSSTIIAEYANTLPYSTSFLDCRKLIVTDDSFGKAVPDFAHTQERLKKSLCAKSDHVYILQGFIAANRDNVTTTLGRGGSDYTATIIGSLIDAERIEIWTDVHGIMTCDPRIVKTARPVSHISYEEAAELAFFGAQVIHPSTVQPAAEKNIAVWIKNTRDAEHHGTIIHSPATKSPHELKAISIKNDVYLLQLRSSRMLNSHGFLSRMFALFTKHAISVDIVTTSEVSVTVSMDSAPSKKLIQELQTLGSVSIESEQSIVCLVGKQIWSSASVITQAFQALNTTPVRLISLGASDTNLTIVVHSSYAQHTIQKLHATFFESV